MEHKIKIGIVGMGRMGITHYSIINSHPNVEIVSISDTSKILLDLMSKYIPGLQTFQDYKEQILVSKPDAILICTPPTIHYQICKMAFEQKIHVFCEKPFTASPEQSEELANVFEGSGLVNQVGYVNRFNGVFRKAKFLLDQGVIGPVIRFRSEMFSATVIKPSEGKGWRATHESGGGVTYEMASHAIDLINFFCGAPDSITGSTMNQVFSSTVEDVVSATFKYHDQKCGLLYVNWCDSSYRKPVNKLEMMGPKGKLLVDQYSVKLFLNEDVPSQNFKKGWNELHITDVAVPVPFYVRGNEFTEQLYAFVNQIIGKESNNIGCTFREGARIQHQIAAIFADAKQNNEQGQ